MNLPNKLTIFRIILIPVYIIFLMIDITPIDNYIATAIFVLASLTDLFDGRIARKRGIVTNFGIFADPLADKLLTAAAFICFVSLGMMPEWVCIIIIAREFAVSGFRLIAASNGSVIAASKWGKFKTITQMIYIIVATLNGAPLFNWMNLPEAAADVYGIVTIVLMYAALVLTVVSMIDYFYKNKDAFTTTK